MATIKEVIGALEEESRDTINGAYSLMRSQTIKATIELLKSLEKPEEAPKAKTTRRTKKA